MSVMNIKDISKKLRERRSEWTRFAEQTGLSRKTFERIAAGESDPRLSTLNKINNLLNK